MYIPDSPYLRLLENQIDIQRIPFSDYGSRLLVFQSKCDNHALSIKLAERLTAVQPGLSVYRDRPPFIQHLQLVDGNGTPLAFEVTTYPHALIFQTLVGEIVLTFQDGETLAFGLPPGVACGIQFTVLPDFLHPDGNGGVLKSIRNFSYTTNGTVHLNRIANLGSGYDTTLIAEGDVDTAITLHIQPGLDLNRSVLPFRQTRTDAERRWHMWFAKAPSVDEPYQRHYYYAWWVLGNNILAPQDILRRAIVAPSKAYYVGAWQWDNYFHALALRYMDAHLARDQILSAFDHQLHNGQLPDAWYDEGIIDRLHTDGSTEPDGSSVGPCQRGGTMGLPSARARPAHDRPLL